MCLKIEIDLGVYKKAITSFIAYFQERDEEGIYFSIHKRVKRVRVKSSVVVQTLSDDVM